MATISLPRLLAAAALILLTSAFLRLLYILPSTRPTRPVRRRRGTPTRLLIVLGSGGHTAEMLAMLQRGGGLDPAMYTHRSYVVSEGDAFGAGKAEELEAGLVSVNALPAEGKPAATGYDISTVPRARKIHQPLLTTPFSALRCLIACIRVLHSPPAPYSSPRPRYPDLILTNGPGTAVSLVLAALLLRFLGAPGSAGSMRTVYVESYARVRGLSLSGRILVRCVDRFLVQWPGLGGVGGGRAEYRGVLV
ncbi:MAG: UDP-N-acetylglucosamine transferase subunit [Thelocarpon impressellum]|nr:MAG: UDP-N-acetylglucosamine transferase subunit [Thelocarpon impressellum]